LMACIFCLSPLRYFGIVVMRNSTNVGFSKLIPPYIHAITVLASQYTNVHKQTVTGTVQLRKYIDN
jgi:hypothetical protein